ncbi:hypothetical protein HNY73_004795 [Argiope bruennichi]|uniref:Uncharacterized protein n=1 Tax=Argiope bruennichi TaxID=94029 RepID=A0A8T0FUG0_ARGBR|nr:hypothetical protein HNY73_004795 [Argiope bruennichi]
MSLVLSASGFITENSCLLGKRGKSLSESEDEWVSPDIEDIDINCDLIEDSDYLNLEKDPEFNTIIILENVSEHVSHGSRNFPGCPAMTRILRQQMLKLPNLLEHLFTFLDLSVCEDEKEHRRKQDMSQLIDGNE